jgi:phytoene desaturase
MSELMDVALDTFFIMPCNSMGDLLEMAKKNPRLLKFAPAFVSSYQNLVQRFFKHERILETLGYQSLYIGYPPALVPGVYAMIPYSEHRGIFYPRGGMVQIPEALRRCGAAYGMETRLNALVQQVMVSNGRVQGVRLADGSELTAPVVVSNINAKTLYLKLIGQEHLPAIVAEGVKSYRYSKAVPMIYLGLDYSPPLDSHHSLIGVTPEGVNRYWWDHVERGRLMEENIGLICWPTHSDPSLAPDGHHVLNLIPEGFYHLTGTDWDQEKPGFVERTLDYLSRFAVPGLKDHVQTVACETPLDFERHLLLPEGAIYCLQQDLTAMAMFRPAARSKAVQGLYLTGSSTHPGGGVPTTIASGYITAGLIERHEG